MKKITALNIKVDPDGQEGFIFASQYKGLFVLGSESDLISVENQ